MLRVVYLTTLISTIHPLKQCVYFRYRKNCNHPFFEVNVPFLVVVPLFVTRCHSLSFAVTLCPSLSLVVPLVVIRCHWLYHSLLLVVPLVVTCCTTRCYSLSFAVTRCHSMNLSSVFLWTIWQQQTSPLHALPIPSFSISTCRSG